MNAQLMRKALPKLTKSSASAAAIKEVVKEVCKTGELRVLRTFFIFHGIFFFLRGWWCSGFLLGFLRRRSGVRYPYPPVLDKCARGFAYAIFFG